MNSNWAQIKSFLTALALLIHNISSIDRFCTPPVSRRAYVTCLVNPSDHILGVRVLVKSLRNSGAQSKDVIVITTEQYYEQHQHEISVLSTENIQLQVVPELDGIETNTRVLLHLWKLLEYDRIIYFDSRTMVEKNPDSLFACEGFCARLGDKESFEELSTGVLVLEPSELAHDEMLLLAASQQGSPSEVFSNFFQISSCSMFDQMLTVFDGDLGSAKEYHQGSIVLSNSETMPLCSPGTKSHLNTCRILPYTYSAASTDYSQGKWKDKDCNHWLCAEIPQPHAIRFTHEEQPWNSLEYPKKPLFWKWDQYRQQLDHPYGDLMSPWAMFWVPCCVMLASLSFLRKRLPSSYFPKSMSGEVDDSCGWHGGLSYRSPFQSSADLIAYSTPASPRGKQFPWAKMEVSNWTTTQDESTPKLIQPKVARLTTMQEIQHSIYLETKNGPNPRPWAGKKFWQADPSSTPNLQPGVSWEHQLPKGALALPRHIAYAAGILVGVIGYLWYKTIYRVSLDMVEPEWHPSSAIMVYQAWLGCGLLCGMLLIDYGYHFFCTRALYFLKDLSVALPFYATVLLLMTRWNLAVGCMVAMANIFLGIFYRNGGFQYSLAQKTHYGLLLLSCLVCTGSVLAVCFWDEPKEQVKKAAISVCIDSHTWYMVMLYCSVVCGPHLCEDLKMEWGRMTKACLSSVGWVKSQCSWRLMLLVPFAMGAYSLQLVLYGQSSIRLPQHCLYHRTPTMRGYLNPSEHGLATTCGEHNVLRLEATTEYFEGFRQYKFCLKTSSGQYLSLHRSLQDECTPDNQFVLHPKGRSYCLYSSIAALYLSSTRYPQAHCTETELWELDGFINFQDFWDIVPQTKAVFQSGFFIELPVVSFSFYFLSIFILWMWRKRNHVWYTVLSSLVWSLLPIHLIHMILNDLVDKSNDEVKMIAFSNQQDFLPPVDLEESRHCELMWELMISCLSRYYLSFAALISLHIHLSSERHMGFTWLGLNSLGHLELWKIRLTGVLMPALAGCIAHVHQGSWLGIWHQSCQNPREEEHSETIICSAFQCLIFGFSVGALYVLHPSTTKPLFAFGICLTSTVAVMLFSLAFDAIYICFWVFSILGTSWYLSSMYVKLVISENRSLTKIIYRSLRWLTGYDSLQGVYLKLAETRQRILSKKNCEPHAQDDSSHLQSFHAMTATTEPKSDPEGNSNNPP